MRLVVPLSGHTALNDPQLQEVHELLRPLLSVKDLPSLELLWTFHWECEFMSPKALEELNRFEQTIATALKKNGNGVTSRIEGGYHN